MFEISKFVSECIDFYPLQVYNILDEKIKAVITSVHAFKTDCNYTCVSFCFFPDFSEAMVKFPSEEKAKEFIGTLEGGDIVAKLLPARKRKVEPMGGGYMDEGNYVV